MSEERRRYFRISDTIGLSFQIINADGRGTADNLRPNAVNLISENDEAIESLINAIADENPKISKLAALLNQKLERVASLLALESDMLDRIAHRVQDVNISACGIAFGHDERMTIGAQVRMDITLFPSRQKMATEGVIVGCEQASKSRGEFYCRVDFIGMSAATQEKLIQHIVQNQNASLKARKDRLS